MLTLYINTATNKAVVALYDGKSFKKVKSWISQQDESEKLLPMIRELLSESSFHTNDIDQLLVCIGPGGFTSTRVGVSFANAWSFAKHTPVASVSVFDLYPKISDFSFVTSNPNEGWMKKPDSTPEFVVLREMVFPSSFAFTGLLHDECKIFLENHGGIFLYQVEQLPRLEQIEFSHELLKPWYYKDVNITKSKK